MRPVDASTSHRTAARDASCGDGAPAASQFGDSLRAAAQRANGALGESPNERPSPRPDKTSGDSTTEESRATHSTAGASQPAATPPRAETTARNGEVQPQPRESRTSTTQGDVAPAPADAVEARDARPRPHAPAHDRASPRDTRRPTDKPRPPEGMALQTLLAAANPLLAGSSDTTAAPTPSALTPHDVAASVTQTWLREPSTQDVAGTDGGAQWTFTLGDPLTPLAALRISGDAAAGWGLQLTAGNGLPARDLAAYTERLRQRLRARGQAVDRLEVDDDPQR